MKKIKSLLIATAVTAVAVVPVFANITGLVSTSVSTSTSTSTSTSVSVSQNVYLTGDVDNNGKVTLEDAQKVLRAALKLETLEAQATKAADVNNDGKVTLEDANKVLRVALKLDNF